ncbi:unnamed protein product [Adineta ricciae]|uniref:G-protein coupled receptors family 1 profile domain-containing protein n=1 Tax=Adineta ricciae TaxID=249248 RepID=A0A815WET5_ADIRI|nr:unnamed protein product [Adineta ricciae]
MSSDYEIIALLSAILKYFHQIGGPILMIIGSVSCIFNLCVFGRKSLRKNPCTIYLIATNINGLLLIYTSTLYMTLAFGYSIDPTAYNVVFCRFRFYTMFLFEILSPCYIILASIDRVLITSQSALTRRKSTNRLAYVSITIVTIFWSIVHCHSFIFMNLVSFAPGFSACFFQPASYLLVMSYYPLVVKVFLIPCLMITFGLYTVRNIRKVNKTAPTLLIHSATTANGNSRIVRSKDQQLIKILLMDITVYIVFNLIQSVIVIYQQIGQNQPHTILQSQIGGFIFILALTCSPIPFYIGCYTNLIVSKTFRQEMKNILMLR